MDITLERILSLIPKKPDGKFQHGAKKAFAESIGLKSGNLISDWINSRSESYHDYVYQIAAVYHVSVEWLKGETDERAPAPTDGDGLVPKSFAATYNSLSEQGRAELDRYAQYLLSREAEQKEAAGYQGKA